MRTLLEAFLEVLIASALAVIPTIIAACSFAAMGLRYGGPIDLAVFCISLVVVFAILQRQRLEH